MSAAVLTSLLNGWAAIHAEYWLLWTLHWRAKGTGYYGDHLLYQRLYEARQAELDRMAEVTAAVGGADVLKPVAGLANAQRIAAQIESQPVSDVEKALMAAQTTMEAMNHVSQAVKGTPYALAIDNAVGGIADAHLEAVYLLQQRLSSGPLNPKRLAKNSRVYGSTRFFG
jgi:DNA-binding ferritin-like protein